MNISPLMIQISGALEPGLNLHQREAMIASVREALGIKLYRWSHIAPAWITRFSMALVGFGRIILSKEKAAASREEILCTVVHEVTHAARARIFGASRWRAFYFLNPAFRRAEELEADAHGIAMRARVYGYRISGPEIQKVLGANAAQWSEWRAPYFCGGAFGSARADLDRRVCEILLKGVLEGGEV